MEAHHRPSQSNPEYKNIIMLLNAKLSNPQEKKYSSAFFDASLHYVLNQYKTNFSKHLLCTPELADIVIEMTPLFLVERPDDDVGMFREIVDFQMNQCIDCVRVYHKKMRKLIQRWKGMYDETSIESFRNKIESYCMARIRKNLAKLKQSLLGLGTMDSQELLGIEDRSSDPNNISSIFEVLCFPRSLQQKSLNKLFVEVVTMLIQRGNCPQPTDYFLPGVFIASLHENHEIQSWAWSTFLNMNMNLALNLSEVLEEEFDSVICSILSYFVELNTFSTGFYTQYPFTNDILLSWKGVEMILLKMEKEIITDFFVRGKSNIITAFINYLPYAVESSFIEMINCFSIILEKVGNEFWRLISNQAPAFVQLIFDTFFSINKMTRPSSSLCTSLVLALKVLRTAYPKKRSSEQDSDTDSPEEPIWLVMLREDSSKINDVYCETNRITDMDNVTKLDYQLRCIVWRNLFKYASENILTSNTSATVLSFMEFFNKIALMDNILDTNQTSIKKDNLTDTLAESISITNEHMNAFLEKLQKIDTKQLTTILPVNSISFSIIHLLSSPDAKLMMSGLVILKRLYVEDSYNKLIRESTKSTIQGLIETINIFLQWTDVGCDTLKLAICIKDLLNRFFPLIFGTKGIFKSKDRQDDKNLALEFWNISWIGYSKVFQMCAKWDRMAMIMRKNEIKNLLLEFLNLATVTLKALEDPTLKSSISLNDTQKLYFSILCTALEFNDKDLLKVAVQKTVEILDFLIVQKCVIEAKLYVKLSTFLNSENILNESELRELSRALGNHIPEFLNENSVELLSSEDELLDSDCDSIIILEKFEDSMEQVENASIEAQLFEATPTDEVLTSEKSELDLQSTTISPSYVSNSSCDVVESFIGSYDDISEESINFDIHDGFPGPNIPIEDESDHSGSRNTIPGEIPQDTIPVLGRLTSKPNLTKKLDQEDIYIPESPLKSNIMLSSSESSRSKKGLPSINDIIIDYSVTLSEKLKTSEKGISTQANRPALKKATAVNLSNDLSPAKVVKRVTFNISDTDTSVDGSSSSNNNTTDLLEKSTLSFRKAIKKKASMSRRETMDSSEVSCDRSDVSNINKRTIQDDFFDRGNEMALVQHLSKRQKVNNKDITRFKAIPFSAEKGQLSNLTIEESVDSVYKNVERSQEQISIKNDSESQSCNNSFSSKSEANTSSMRSGELKEFRGPPKLQNPSLLSSLHKQILLWDIDLRDDFPPNVTTREYRDIPNDFNSVEEYITTFEPLLLLEFWQRLIDSMEEIDEVNQLMYKLQSITMVDDFVEIQLMPVRKESLLFKKLTENDLMYITQKEEYRPPKNFLALVKSVKTDRSNAGLTLKCFFGTDPKNIKSSLGVNSEWRASKIISLKPLTREYDALTSLSNFVTKDFILKPFENEIPPISYDDIVLYKHIYNVNESQARAILRVVKGKPGFSLIQGPPGTGKTSTIVGIISAVFAFNSSGKILVCAPSNAAVDELVKRLMNGIYNSYGKLNRVNVVRIGSPENCHEDVKHKTLDYQAEKISRNSSIITAKQEILSSADIICSTLTGSGHEILNIFNEFDTVIIDEAAQAVELNTLIPLKFNPRRCVLVGDPNQLPPTVLSHVATQHSYEQSLFVRIRNNFKNKESIMMLNTQYRMHPLISNFPGSYFYNNLLKDAPEIESDLIRPWHANILYAPYRFYNVAQSEMEQDKNHSLYNPVEARVLASAYRRLVLDFPDIKNWSSLIGVITPYKKQKLQLEIEFGRVHDLLPYKMKVPEIKTVDGFQGREKEIIMFSCVRAGEDKTLGFLGDIRRMNVAMTRAKRSLWIFGCQKSLVHNKAWEALISDAKARAVYTNASVEFFSRSIFVTDSVSQESDEESSRSRKDDSPTRQKERKSSLRSRSKSPDRNNDKQLSRIRNKSNVEDRSHSTSRPQSTPSPSRKSVEASINRDKSPKEQDKEDRTRYRNRNEPVRKEINHNESARKEINHNESIRKETNNDESVRKETNNDESVRKETNSNESVRKETSRNESVRNEINHIESVRKETSCNESVRKETSCNESVRKEISCNESVRKDIDLNESVCHEISRNESIRNGVSRNEPVRNETSRNESGRKETNRNESIRNETSRNESGRKETNRNESIRNETNHNESVRNETNHYESIRNEANHNESVRNETNHIESVRNEVNHKESVRNEINHKESVRNEINHKESVRNETNQNESIRNEKNHNESVHDETSRNGSIRNETDRNESVRKEIKHNEHVDNEISRNEFVHNETSRNEFARGEIGRNESSCNENDRNESACDEISRNESVRSEISRNESARNEIGRNESARNKIIRNKINHNEISRNKTNRNVVNNQFVETHRPLVEGKKSVKLTRKQMRSTNEQEWTFHRERNFHLPYRKNNVRFLRKNGKPARQKDPQNDPLYFSHFYQDSPDNNFYHDVLENSFYQDVPEHSFYHDVPEHSFYHDVPENSFYHDIPENNFYQDSPDNNFYQDSSDNGSYSPRWKYERNLRSNNKREGHIHNLSYDNQERVNYSFKRDGKKSSISDRLGKIDRPVECVDERVRKLSRPTNKRRYNILSVGQEREVQAPGREENRNKRHMSPRMDFRRRESAPSQNNKRFPRRW
ncbi:8727_t:CDS:2 [Acaulospora morrowiae]|uniref:8727_t:CDS:1 n=1 Tax=Acaulospora morrowiae TaxID=94023 RepID=A0A9N8YTB0_9GLOM|nr:8727_t:CDS:2 [Acaulospora morrowiae]